MRCVATLVTTGWPDHKVFQLSFDVVCLFDSVIEPSLFSSVLCALSYELSLFPRRVLVSNISPHVWAFAEMSPICDLWDQAR